MTDINRRITEMLLEHRDEEYAVFNARIIPNVDPARVMGVRAPDIKAVFRELKGEDLSGFLSDLPHLFIEEYYLHAQIINNMRNFNNCLTETERLLPYIDNWESCDSLTPKALSKDKPALIERIKVWHKSSLTYTVRFATGCLMRYFLGEDFKREYAEMAASIRSEEYYINMMTAWYFATALAKNYDEVMPFIEQRRLDDWTHNKAIQKATESYRVTDEHKEYLRSLRIK